MNPEMKKKMIYDLMLEYVKQKEVFKSAKDTGEAIEKIAQFCKDTDSSLQYCDELNDII